MWWLFVISPTIRDMHVLTLSYSTTQSTIPLWLSLMQPSTPRIQTVLLMEVTIPFLYKLDQIFFLNFFTKHSRTNHEINFRSFVIFYITWTFSNSVQIIFDYMGHMFLFLCLLMDKLVLKIHVLLFFSNSVNIFPDFLKTFLNTG